MKVVAAATLNCKLIVCDNDQVFLGIKGDEGYRQYYSLEPLTSDFIWMDDDLTELDRQLELFEGEL